MKTKLWPLAVLCALLASSTAHADAIPRGTFALGAERITGVFHSEEKVGNGRADHTAFALFGNAEDSPVARAWQLPRITFDYFVTNGLSIGGSFIVLARSHDGYDQTDIVVAPRIGFGYMFTRVVGIWPKGGLSYWHASFSPDNSNAEGNEHAFAFDLDVPLVIAPVRSFAITIGPLLDVSFDGRASGDANVANVNAGTSVDMSFVQYGLTAGIVGLL